MTIAVLEIKSESAITATRFGSKLRDVMVSQNVEVEDGAKGGSIVHQQIPSRLLVLNINTISTMMASILDIKKPLNLSPPCLNQVQTQYKSPKIKSEQDQEAVVKTLSGKIAPELN